MSLLESRTKNRWENPKDQERQMFGFSGFFLWVYGGLELLQFIEFCVRGWITVAYWVSYKEQDRSILRNGSLRVYTVWA